MNELKKIELNSRNLQNRGMIFRISPQNVTHPKYISTLHLSQRQLISYKLGM
jgi:hypothetical protein